MSRERDVEGERVCASECVLERERERELLKCYERVDLLIEHRAVSNSVHELLTSDLLEDLFCNQR